MAFVSGGFEAIGTGKYASGIALANFLNTVHLPKRRTGIDPLEGIFTLFVSALSAAESFREVGGYCNLALISRDPQKQTSLTQFIYGDQAKLGSEIVQAFRCDQISRDIAFDLLDKLVFKKDFIFIFLIN